MVIGKIHTFLDVFNSKVVAKALLAFLTCFLWFIKLDLIMVGKFKSFKSCT